MIRSAHELKGYSVNALDGEVGEAKDFLFDDRKWVIRYMVVGAGGWLTGRRLLLRPDCLGKPRWAKRNFPIGAFKVLNMKSGRRFRVEENSKNVIEYLLSSKAFPVSIPERF